MKYFQFFTPNVRFGVKHNADSQCTDTIIVSFIIFTEVTFVCNGTAGHGSLLLKNTSGEKLNYILNKMTEFRSREAKTLDESPDLTIGDVTTVNLTMLEGGVQSNVVPPVMSITFDVRMAIDRSQKEFEAMVYRVDETVSRIIEKLQLFSVTSFV